MIAERGGGYNVKGTRTGKFHNREVDGLTRKVIYLLTADPRFEGLPSGRRVAQVDSTEILPWLPSDDAELYAERFTAALEQWNQTMRGERAASQYLCIDRSFSFAPDDPVDPITAVTIVQDLIERVMEGGERLALYVVHTDKPHLHVHVIASVVDIHGQIFNRRNDDDLWAEEMSELEQVYGLRKVDHSPRRSSTRSKGSDQKTTKGAATCRAPHKAALRQGIQDAVSEARGNFPEFLEALDRRDIQLVGRQRTERADSPFIGISFYRDGETFTGTQLSPDLAWPVLRSRVGFRHDQHQDSLRERTQRYEVARNVRCVIKPVLDGSAKSDVIELPERKPDKRKLAVLASMQREVIDSATVDYRWPTGGDRWFREFHPSALEVKGPKTGFMRFSAEQAPRLSTRNGMSRKVIRRMLVRACQLGWRRLVIEGSKAFVKLANALCQHWLKGVVHEPRSQRVSPLVATAVGEMPLSTPTPQLSSRRRPQPQPARTRVEKREDPAPLREVPSRIDVVERAVMRDAIKEAGAQSYEAIHQVPADCDEVSARELLVEAGDSSSVHAPADIERLVPLNIEMAQTEHKPSEDSHSFKLRRIQTDNGFDPMG